MMSDKEKTVYICAEDKMIENNQIVDIQSRQSVLGQEGYAGGCLALGKAFFVGVSEV